MELKRLNNRWEELFNKIDVNGDKVITFNELRNAIDSDPSNSYLSEYAKWIIFEDGDTDGNGTLDLDEFIKLMNHSGYASIFQHLLQCRMSYLSFMLPPSARKKIPIRIRYKFWPAPITMVLVTIVTFCFFLYDELYDHSLRSYLIYKANRRKEVWRYLTYMLVHLDYFHMVGNATAQIVLALPLEMVHGQFRVFWVYFIGVLAGSLTTSVFDSFSDLGGTSGGVYCLLAGHLATVLMNWGEMSYVWHIVLVLLFVTYDFGTSAYATYGGISTDKSIGYMAHVGGAIAGILVGVVVLKNLLVQRGEKLTQRICLSIFVIAVIGAIIVNIVLPWHYPIQEV